MNVSDLEKAMTNRERAACLLRSFGLTAYDDEPASSNRPTNLLVALETQFSIVYERLEAQLADVTRERDEARHALAVAVDALEWYNAGSGDVARNALAKIRSTKWVLDTQ